MPLVSTKSMLLAAQEGGYAVGAFNVENLEMIKAVISAAAELRAPVILQTTPSTIRYGNLASFAAMAAAEAEKQLIPIALHLDHGDSFSLAAQALKQGYTSLMIDGSKCSFEENIELTGKVVEMAFPNDIPVEAELGTVGGKEDDLSIKDGGVTDPVQAREFAQRTHIDSLAVAIGTAHGFYRKTPHLDLKRLEEIREQVDIPLVLHGASGLSDESVRECIRRGICKVNFATELRAAYTGAVKRLLAEKPDTYDPKKIGQAGIDGVKQVVNQKIQVCGCSFCC